MDDQAKRTFSIGDPWGAVSPHGLSFERRHGKERAMRKPTNEISNALPMLRVEEEVIGAITTRLGQKEKTRVHEWTIHQQLKVKE